VVHTSGTKSATWTLPQLIPLIDSSLQSSRLIYILKNIILKSHVFPGNTNITTHITEAKLTVSNITPTSKFHVSFVLVLNAWLLCVLKLYNDYNILTWDLISLTHTHTHTHTHRSARVTRMILRPIFSFF
jgi:hypothetical protein